MAGKIVLVLEDDRTLQESVRKLVEGHGFRVVMARSLPEAQRLLDRITRPCLILLDMLMHEGREAMAKLGAHYPLATIPVRVSSSNVRRMSKKSVQLDVLSEMLLQHCGQPISS
jgi:CheY-like chemotaxis protein